MRNKKHLHDEAKPDNTVWMLSVKGHDCSQKVFLYRNARIAEVSMERYIRKNFYREFHDTENDLRLAVVSHYYHNDSDDFAWVTECPIVEKPWGSDSKKKRLPAEKQEPQES